uniref:LysM domain-containing protein n=1 Tax=Hemiselmis tepida TaxID=464990 RepID=A0A7S0YUI7_9CRYP
MPRPEAGYQPRVGDTVKIAGFETPRFVTQGVEEYLEVVVTQATEQVSNRSEIGRQAPHTPDDVTWWRSNWFEGVSTYEVTYPDRNTTYVAEVHGCCRMSDMCQNDATCRQQMQTQTESEANIPNFRDGTGIWTYYNTPFFLQATVRLDLDPPPLFFLPLFVPFMASESGVPQDLELAVLDYQVGRGGAATELVPQDPEPWPEMVMRRQKEATGSLAGTKSRPVTGRRLQNFDFQEGDLTSLDNYPPPRAPSAVVTDPSVTGVDVRLVNTPSHHVRLFAGASCSGLDAVDVPAGMDVCPRSSAARTFPSGGGVDMNFTSVWVPAGLHIAVSDACEFSEPPPSHSEGFFRGQAVAECDNREGTGPMCCEVPGAGGRTLRAQAAPKQVPPALRILGNQWLRIYYSEVAGGRTKVILRTEEVSVFNDDGEEVLRRSAPAGNYAVRLRLATPTSASATVEFILHVMTTVSYSLTPVPAPPADGSPVMVPTGFPTRWALDVSPDESKFSDKTFFDTSTDPSLFLPLNRPVAPADPPGAALPGVLTSAPQWAAEWTPCLDGVGLYFSCTFVLMAIAPYDWAPIRCALVRVAQDLPPKVAFFDPADPSNDRDHYRVHMGQALHVTARAADNPSDPVDFLGVLSVDAVTGDAIRARVEYVTDRGEGTISGDGANEGWARLVEPLLPVYLKMAVRAPGGVNSLGFSAPYVVERTLELRPSRLHSGLGLSVCFVAADSRGLCKRVGSHTSRCVTVDVVRCRYAMRAGESLSSVAGMFETSWLQLYALNPTHLRADRPVDNTTFVHVGHPYTFGRGETVHSVMLKFGTDLQHLMLLNADISRQTEHRWTNTLPVGTEMPQGYQICVLPNSCGTNV